MAGAALRIAVTKKDEEDLEKLLSGGVQPVRVEAYGDFGHPALPMSDLHACTRFQRPFEAHRTIYNLFTDCTPNCRVVDRTIECHLSLNGSIQF
jgi:hypothetical protein